MQQRIDRHNWFAEYGDLLTPAPMFKAFTAIAEIQAFTRLAYNQEDHDCGVRALAVSCAADYQKAHWALQESGRLPGNPCSVSQMFDAACRLRCRMVRVSHKAKTLLTVERELASTRGGFILTTCNHAVGLWNGELIDHARGRLWRVTEIYRVEPMRSKTS